MQSTYIELRAPAAAPKKEIKKLSEWFGALGRADFRKLNLVGCEISIAALTDCQQYKPAELHIHLVNNSSSYISFKVVQKFRLSKECFISVQPPTGHVDRGETSLPIQVHMVLFQPFSLKHLLHIKCTSSRTGETFYLPIGLHFISSRSPSSLLNWSVKILPSDIITTISTKPNGYITLCKIFGVEVANKTWHITTKDGLPQSYSNQLAEFKSLSHPHLISFIATNVESNEASIIVEYAANGNLAQFLARADPVNRTMKFKISVACDVASALAYLLSKGRNHLKIDSKTVLIDRNFKAKLSGFGSIVPLSQPLSKNNNNIINNYIDITTSAAEDHNGMLQNQNENASTAPPPVQEPINPEYDLSYRFGVFMWTLLSDDRTIVSDPKSKLNLIPNSNIAISSSTSSIQPSSSPSSLTLTPLTQDDLVVSEAYQALYPDYVELLRKCVSSEASTRPSITTIFSTLSIICDTTEPRTSKDMNLSTNTTLTDTSLSRLPKTLTFLDLSLNTNISSECFPNLPTTLKHLFISNLQEMTKICDCYISSLKASIASKNHSCTNLISISSSSPSISLITNSSSFVTSKENSSVSVSSISSSTIEIPRYIFNWLTPESISFISSLPLTTVIFSYLPPHLGDDFIKFLPRSMTSLELGDAWTITDACLPFLPPQLISLSISTPHFSNDSTHRFPRSLERLILPLSCHLDCLELPPNLTELTLGGSSFFTSFASLPKALTRLDLGNCPNIKDEDIKDLPSGLISLIISEAKMLTSKSILDGQFSHMDKTLQHLKVSGNAEFGDVTLPISSSIALISNFSPNASSNSPSPSFGWPSNLSRIELPDNVSFDVSNLSFLPKSLIHFDLSSNENVGNDWIPLLPMSLTSLLTSDETQLTEACFPFLPPNIATLNVVIPSIHVRELPRKLTSLNLERCHVLADTCLSELPASLTYLKLCCKRINDVGISYLPPHLKTLHLIDIVYLTDQCAKHMPNSLTKLIFDDCDCFTAACLKYLPRGLTDLHLPPCVILDINDESVKDLPRLMTELNLSKNEDIGDSAIARLPRTLTHLNMEDNKNLTSDSIKHLPRTLNYLTLEQCEYLDPSCLTDFPPHLTSLVLPSKFLSKLKNTDVIKIPRFLRSIDLSKSFKLTYKCLRDLPRTLTHMDFPAHIIPDIPDEASLWIPPLLIELDFANNTTWTDEAIKHLPKTLTKLNLYWNPNLTDACIPNLPRSLLYLNLGSSGKLTDLCIAHLPQKLLELCLDANRNFTDSCIKQLPRSLTSINMAFAYLLTPDSLGDFPRSITQWSISPSLLNNLDLNHLRFLPPSLVELDMWDNRKAGDDCIPLLPRNLKSLILSNAFQITSLCIPFLPKKLTKLNLSENFKLEDSCISYLPRTIIHLNIANATRLTSSCAKNFPPNLTHLDLSENTSVTDAWIPLLPRSINVLMLGNSDLTATCITSLPPQLIQFDMPGPFIASLTGELLSQLPKSMTILNLWCNTILNNTGLKSIPKITTLNLNMNNVLTDSAISFLPHGLTSLNMSSNSKLTNACIQDLPKTLQDLNLASAILMTDEAIFAMKLPLVKRLIITKARVTDACIPHLPKTLTQLGALGLSRDLLRKTLPVLKWSENIM